MSSPWELQIVPASRVQRFARIALTGPASAGKTWTALAAATEMAGEKPILLIDTERSSGALYADNFKYYHADWTPPYDPRRLASELRRVASDFGVIIIDSITHFWMGEGGVLEIVEKAGEKVRGNNYAGWRVGTPAQNEMVEALLSVPTHVIATMRVKTEYAQEKDSSGKTTIRKLGLAPIQRDGIEYEFTVVGELDLEHRLTITKSRCPLIADQIFPQERHKAAIRDLMRWLDSAEPEAEQPAVVEPQPVLQPAQQEAGFTWKSAKSAIWRKLVELDPEVQKEIYSAIGQDPGDAQLASWVNDLPVETLTSLAELFEIEVPA